MKNTEKNVYKTSITLPATEIARINRLLSIPNLGELTDAQLREQGATMHHKEGVFSVDFADGSDLTWDLCSGSENYFDDVVWTGKDGEQIVLDCSYELDSISFDHNGCTYEVEIQSVGPVMPTFLLISVSERDIEVKPYFSYESAYRAMLEEVKTEFLKRFSEEEWEETVDSEEIEADCFDIKKDGAWSNIDDDCLMDWKIIDLTSKNLEVM